MWIGDKLVEADIVEKQRAREIYETILREKRDPGLLEWAGGNDFKARVYPIPPRGEKRIKITYTQVLPLRGNRYRYSYALQSELLKQHPLRDLSIDLKVNSAVPIKSVSSPTHPARVAVTEHSGHVEFSAQEYTPTRDFEAVVEIEQPAVRRRRDSASPRRRRLFHGPTHAAGRGRGLGAAVAFPTANRCDFCCSSTRRRRWTGDSGRRRMPSWRPCSGA